MPRPGNAVAGQHLPVLYNEVLEGLQPRPGGVYIDGTVGAGGHAAGLLERSAPDGRLLGLDRDPAALAQAGARLAGFGARVRLEQASYLQMADFAPEASADGVLLDLGLSSLQLDDPARGFSFQGEGALDMRFGPDTELTAALIVNEWPADELADVLFEYGEERLSRRIARAIVAARPLHTTRELAEVVSRAAGGRREKIHPATRTFQALRMAVNEELEAVAAVLPLAASRLRPGGRLAVISFHSLEDRRVKHYFRELGQAAAEAATSLPAWRVLTRKPIEPTAAETAANPRARSARLRIVERGPAPLA